MLLTELVPLWIAAEKTEHVLRANSVRSYACYVRLLQRWMGEGATHLELTPAKLKSFYRYFENLTDAEGNIVYRPRTVHLGWRGVAAFCRWLVEAEHLAENPFPRIKMIELDDAERPLVSDTEAVGLYLACDRMVNEYRAALARAVILVLTGSALRNTELRSLNLADLNLDAGTVRVRRGKRGKPRTQTLTDRAVIALRAWLGVRPKGEYAALFVLRGTTRLGNWGLMSLLGEAAAIAGYKGAKNLKPHSLRHYSGTRFYMNNKKDIVATRLFLGHERLETTLIYVHADAEKLLEMRNATDLPLPEKAEEISPAPISSIPTIPPGAEVETHHLPVQRYKH